MEFQPLSPDQLLGALHWRVALKQFDPARKISAADWTHLEQALVLSASSYGMQPYHFLVITDPTLRQQLSPATYNQPQIVNCSHLVVFASRTAVTEAEVDEFMNLVAQTRHQELPKLDQYRQMIVGDLVQGPRSKVIAEWTARQAYIALGNLLTSAALLGVDACPMEGFSPDQYNQILGLPARGLQAVVLCALGYRSAEDPYVNMAKVRFPAGKLVEKH